MSWGNITGESNILPGGGYGVQDEIKFESGIGKKIRLLLSENEEPYSFLEHCLEVEAWEGGQQVKTFRTIRCPKTHKNPNAPCPLCDGQQVRRRIRHACNVWDYDENRVMRLCAGDAVFKPIATTMKMGVNILAVDWAILKTGTDRNSTEYTCTNLGPNPNNFQIPADAPHYNIEEDYAPHTIEDMKAIVEGAGANWEQLIVPPQLTYPTLQEALDHEMPNGKHKGKKLKDIWEEDKSSRGYINFLATRSDRQSAEKAAAQVILVRLGGVPIEGVPTTDDQVAQQQQQVANQTQTTGQVAQQAVNQNQNQQATGQVQSQVSQSTITNAAVGDRQSKIQDINKLLTTKDRFIKGGFNEILAVMNQCAAGKSNITDFTDAEVDKMLEVCRNA